LKKNQQTGKNRTAKREYFKNHHISVQIEKNTKERVERSKSSVNGKGLIE